jgi:hypothetical protein
MIPYFIIKDYLTMNSDWLTKFDKVHVVGLAEIMIKLFFTVDKNSNQILYMLYESGRYPSCIHYYQFMNLYENKEKNELMEHSLIGLVPKFSEINQMKKDTLIYLIFNLLSKDYKIIYSSKQIKNDFQTQIIDLPTHISTSDGLIVPVDSIQFIPIPSSSSSSKISADEMVGGNKNKNKLLKK